MYKYHLLYLVLIVCSLVFPGCSMHDIREEVQWKKLPDTAQYKGANWKNEVQREHGISLEKAMEIGALDPEITFFFYMKGAQMYLEGKEGPKGWSTKGVFRRGDAVFFKGKPWYGSAPGLADAYEKM